MAVPRLLPNRDDKDETDICCTNLTFFGWPSATQRLRS